MKIKDVNSFKKSVSNIKKIITCFKNVNKSSKNKNKKFDALNTILESMDTIVNFGATSTSISLSITGIGLISLLISAGIACALSLGNKISHKMIWNKYFEYKKQYEKDQQTIKFVDRLYRKSLHDNLIDKTELESSCNTFTKNVNETEFESFC